MEKIDKIISTRCCHTVSRALKFEAFCASAGEAASGGREETPGGTERPAEAGGPHWAGQWHWNACTELLPNQRQVVSDCVAPLQDTLPKQVYSMHQLMGDKQYGTERAGFLYKKSDGWQQQPYTRTVMGENVSEHPYAFVRMCEESLWSPPPTVPLSICHWLLTES